MNWYYTMNWYYKIRGGHTHVRVFMNGAKCGDLCFRNEEFDNIVGCHAAEVKNAQATLTTGFVTINFINES